MAYSKGQIITMNLDGTDREYRILTINGNIAEVVTMFDSNTSCTFNSNNTYSGGNLDTYLNTTWYGGLTTAAKNAIVSKTLTQYQYSYDFYAYNETTHASYAKYSTKSVKASGLTRKVYALDIEDIENYFNHRFSEADILELFWNVRTKPSSAKEVWTRSAISGKSNMAWYVGTYGYMSNGRVENYNAARPAFTIDLSKIFTPGYSITYHADGGTPEPENLTGQTELPTLPIVSKTNYNFVGWYYDSTFTQEAHAGDTLSANVDLYAKFIRSHITIDLTTLSGWGNVADGQHQLTVQAKADNYRDSEKSTAVSFTKGPQVYTDCITFTSETGDFTLSANKEWDGTVEYSTDKTTWTTWDGTAISSNNKKLYLRGSGNTTFYTSSGAMFVLSAKAGCSGNLNTLLEYSNPPTVLSKNACYFLMFTGCTNLTTAPSLPATTLADDCYGNMFNGCTSLTTAPALPATTLASNCYNSMFYDCTNLTTAPELPATTLAVYCYSDMFSGCTSLTTAPELPATTLADGCYNGMFSGCTSLTTAPALPATTLASNCYNGMFASCTAFKVSSTQTGTYQYEWRIPTSGTISSEPSGWNSYMLVATGGTFTSDPSINTTYYVENEPV